MTSKKSRCPNGSIRKPPKTGKCKKYKKTKKSKINKNISTIKCNNYNNIKSIDLNNIKLSNEKYKCDIKNKKIDILKLTYRKDNSIINLCNIKFLNKGSYGEVYEYSNKNYKIAVKSYKYEDDNEIKIIQLLDKLDISCNIVNSRLIQKNNKYFSIMDLMNGSLSEMNGKLKKRTILKIIKDISKHLKCLNDKNLSYTDLKTDNILFKCNNKRYIQVVLGDIGSICKKNKFNSCTYSPWEYRNELGFPKCNESTMVWCLGIVFFELMNINTKIFYWSEIPKYDEIDIIDTINIICDKYKLNKIFINKQKTISIETLLKKIFQTNPKNRITLKSIISLINI